MHFTHVRETRLQLGRLSLLPSEVSHDSGCRRDDARKHRDQPLRQSSSLERAEFDLRGGVAVGLRGHVEVIVELWRRRFVARGIFGLVAGVRAQRSGVAALHIADDVARVAGRLPRLFERVTVASAAAWCPWRQREPLQWV